MRAKDDQKLPCSAEIIYVAYLEEKTHQYTTQVYTISFNDIIEFEFEVSPWS